MTKNFFILLLLISISCSKLNAYLFYGSASEELAKEVSIALNLPLGNCSLKRFQDGEVRIELKEDVANKHVFIIQSTCRTEEGSVNDHFMELLLLARALKRGHVAKITAIIPYYGYSRQDRGENAPISASEVAMLLESVGINRVVTVDIHARQIQGFFHEAALDNLDSTPLFAEYFREKELTRPVVVAPDAGAVPRAVAFQSHLKDKGVETEMAIIIKRRTKPGKIDSVNLIGDIRGCDALIVDDMCDTGGTLTAAAAELKKMGAIRVFACITHPVFSGPAIERIQNSDFTEVIVTNTIPFRKETEKGKIKQISIVPVIKEKFENSTSLFLAKNELF